MSRRQFDEVVQWDTVAVASDISQCIVDIEFDQFEMANNQCLPNLLLPFFFIFVCS